MVEKSVGHEVGMVEMTK